MMLNVNNKRKRLNAVEIAGVLVDNLGQSYIDLKRSLEKRTSTVLTNKQNHVDQETLELCYRSPSKDSLHNKRVKRHKNADVIDTVRLTKTNKNTVSDYYDLVSNDEESDSESISNQHTDLKFAAPNTKPLKSKNENHDNIYRDDASLQQLDLELQSKTTTYKFEITDTDDDIQSNDSIEVITKMEADLESNQNEKDKKILQEVVSRKSRLKYDLERNDKRSTHRREIQAKIYQNDDVIINDHTQAKLRRIVCAGQDNLIMKEVRRIHVCDPNAKDIVTESRKNGVPIVLIGHIGWVNFAKTFLKLPNSDLNQDIDLRGTNSRHEIDVAKMAITLGSESVPISVRDYKVDNPTPEKMTVKEFLKIWYLDDNPLSYYLHQWQFPLSPTAKGLLCNQCKPLPNILGHDILQYHWKIDKEKYDNPYQYLFMGDEDTMTKLHMDAGGLDITIAPITGRKECVLVHRDDGHDCFYDLKASLDNIDLQRYPLMTQARIWKTVIKPGDILLMPQGTYHECRNLTKCLSYSRFILDTVNLLPFYRSMINGDAKEIPHADIMWHCCIEVLRKVDHFVEHKSTYNADETNEIKEVVKTLEALKHYIQEILLSDNKKNEKEAYRKLVADIKNTLDNYVITELS